MRSPRAYAREEKAATAVEFALIASAFLGVMLGIIDMARYAWEFNSAKAATRVGARAAAVGPPAVQQFVDYDAVDALGLAGGQSIPASAPDYTCTSTSCTPSGTLNSTNFTAIVTAMQNYYGRLQAANVVIDYKTTGLGVAGNPLGTDVEPVITVRLQNLTFYPLALRIFNVSLPMPTVATTITSEDLG